MDKNEYIIKLLTDEIKDVNIRVSKYGEELESIRELPNDCKGVTINDVVCENPDYKLDMLESHFHVVGYLNGVRETAKKLLMLVEFDDDEFEKFLIEQDEIKAHNDKVQVELCGFLDKHKRDSYKEAEEAYYEEAQDALLDDDDIPEFIKYEEWIKSNY